MSDRASVREMDFRQMTIAVSGDRETTRGHISGLRPHGYRSAVTTRVLHRADADVNLSLATSWKTELFIRFLDIAGSMGILILTLPVLAVAGMLIRITAGGPVLFRQERVGLRGRLFTLYKFRTMVNDAEKDVGPVWASRNDDRVTPIGRVLRKMRIDELPQLYNILRGDMSLVGPRPERPFFVDRHKALQGVRLAVRPGLTGLAQIRGLYDLKPAHKVRYDYLYIQKRCLLLNVHILLRTIPALFTKMGW